MSCLAWDLARAHGLMCYAYDEQRELICCEAVKILQINGGVGKKNVTDGSE